MHTRINNSLVDLAEKLGLSQQQAEILLAELRNALGPAVFVQGGLPEGPVKDAIGKTLTRIMQIVTSIQDQAELAALLAPEVVANDEGQQEGHDAQNHAQAQPDSITRMRCGAHAGGDAQQAADEEGEGVQLGPDAHVVLAG